MGKVRQLDQIEADIEASRGKYQHLLEFLADKPLLLEELKFVFTTLSDKITTVEKLTNFYRLKTERLTTKIDQLHLDGAIRNMLILKESGRLKGTKVEVLEELQRQRRLSH